MNLYLISQSVNNDYDTYDSAVVCAETEEAARMIHPYYGTDWDGKATLPDTWAAPEFVTVEKIGEAAPSLQAGVVLASFNAG